MLRKASAVWRGSGRENEKGTNPEELIAAVSRALRAEITLDAKLV